MAGKHNGQKEGSCSEQDEAGWCEEFITLLKMALIENKLSTCRIFHVIFSVCSCLWVARTVQNKAENKAG